eukprot:RCo042288
MESSSEPMMVQCSESAHQAVLTDPLCGFSFEAPRTVYAKGFGNLPAYFLRGGAAAPPPPWDLQLELGLELAMGVGLGGGAVALAGCSSSPSPSAVALPSPLETTGGELGGSVCVGLGDSGCSPTGLGVMAGSPTGEGLNASVGE